MTKQTWRDRLEAVLQRDGRSMREVSMSANLSHGYLHGILRENKEPTLDRFERICRELDVSVAYVLLGLDLSADTEAILQAIEGNEARRRALLEFLQS